MQPFNRSPFFTNAKQSRSYRGGRRRVVSQYELRDHSTIGAGGSNRQQQIDRVDEHPDDDDEVKVNFSRARSKKRTIQQVSVEEGVEGHKWAKGEMDEHGVDVAAEVEVDVEETGGVGDSEQGYGQEQHVIVVTEPTREQRAHFVSPAREQLLLDQVQSSSRALTFRPPNNRGRGNAGAHSIQQLLKFDSTQCFDIDELRSRMIAAQRKIEDFCSLNLTNAKLKHENVQLREELAKCDNRIGMLESTVLERNERLKELLRENVYMRAQFKKVQSEFGVDAVKKVFNR